MEGPFFPFLWGEKVTEEDREPRGSCGKELAAVSRDEALWHSARFFLATPLQDTGVWGYDLFGDL